MSLDLITITMVRPLPFKIAPSREVFQYIVVIVPCAHQSPQLKRHLDRFSGVCRAYDRDRQTDHATRSVTMAAKLMPT